MPSPPHFYTRRNLTNKRTRGTSSSLPPSFWAGKIPCFSFTTNPRSSTQCDSLTPCLGNASAELQLLLAFRLLVPPWKVGPSGPTVVNHFPNSPLLSPVHKVPRNEVFCTPEFHPSRLYSSPGSNPDLSVRWPDSPWYQRSILTHVTGKCCQQAPISFTKVVKEDIIKQDGLPGRWPSGSTSNLGPMPSPRARALPT